MHKDLFKCLDSYKVKMMEKLRKLHQNYLKIDETSMKSRNVEWLTTGQMSLSWLLERIQKTYKHSTSVCLSDRDLALGLRRTSTIVHQHLCCGWFPGVVASERLFQERWKQKRFFGGGGTIFSARTQIFSFWTILDHFLWWMIWTALTLPGSGTSPALGVPEGRQKFR